MAKSKQKKRRAEPEKPRARAKGDGMAHDVAVIDVKPPDDIERNPGIGASKGTTISGADADDVEDLYAEGENTFPGDVENDAGRPGAGVDPNRRGRENK